MTTIEIEEYQPQFLRAQPRSLTSIAKTTSIETPQLKKDEDDDVDDGSTGSRSRSLGMNYMSLYRQAKT